MKNTLLLILASFLFIPTYAQNQSGTLSFGYFRAIPMNNLCDIDYDQGNGFKIGFMSRQFDMTSAVKFNWGLRMDIASMDKREFDAIPINTPVPDMGDLTVRNSMYGFFGLARLSFGSGAVQPYAEFLLGHRNLHTKQVITAQNPNLNPEYEAETYYNRVVWTKRFSYGGSVGVSYRLSPGFSLETSVTYTEGGVGAVMPLKDVSQNEVYMNYPHQQSETDMLLINVGIRFRLGSTRSNTSSTAETKPGPPAKTNTRYTNDQDTNSNNSNSNTSSSSSSNNNDTSTKPAKKKLEVKPSTKPKKNETDKS